MKNIYEVVRQRELIIDREIKIPINKLVNYYLKRFLDYFISISLIPFIIPLMVFISVAIILTSKGPVIFTQYRVGKNGKLFKIYKFRTMYINADKKLEKILNYGNQIKQEWEQNRKLKNDPRITPIGKLLRKTSLDELPQFLNVFKGEMSLVGPRPVTIEELLIYYRENIYYYTSVLPGITGLWQVSGRNNTTYEERVNLDCKYITHWSIWLDIFILIKTIKVVLNGDGAY